jgi:hypothetical protein
MMTMDRPVRFTNADALEGVDGVLDEMFLALAQRAAPPSGIYRGREGGNDEDMMS